MDTLHSNGLDRDTLVIFTSDNGPQKEGGNDPEFFKSSGPLRGIKRDLYDGGIREPMIARWPGRIQEGSVTHFAGAFWDFMPTAAELANYRCAGGDRRDFVRADVAGKDAEAARLFVLGISRTRVQPGSADGRLEGRPAKDQCSGGVVRFGDGYRGEEGCGSGASGGDCSALRAL